MTADPDRACEHKDFEAVVAVNRLSEVEGGPAVAFSADIRVNCADCDEPFRWSGLEAGLSHTKPTCSIDEQVLVAPLRPAGADPDFGMGLPGFAVRWRDG